MPKPNLVLDLVKKHDAKYVDLRFTDPRGKMQHLTQHIDTIDENAFKEGIMFDGSSIAGWKSINESDMILQLDTATAVMDPFYADPTVAVYCDVWEPTTGKPYVRCPRSIAKKAEKYLISSGTVDTAFFGPEAEFFIFDDVRFDYSANSSFHSVDSAEGIWNSGREEYPNLGYKIRHKEGYFPVAPHDTLQDIRNEMCLELEKAGVPIERQHHAIQYEDWRTGLDTERLGHGRAGGADREALLRLVRE